MNCVYVLDKNKNPLMPCHSYGRVKRWLKRKEAVIVDYKPFTIQLTRDASDNKTQRCVMGIDPGRTNIGICVVDEKGNELFSSNVMTRNKQIKKLMDDRRTTRMLKRRYRREKRKRRFIKFNPRYKTRTIERYLPHYKKSIYCKIFKNKHARFCNRKRKNGWLTPTATQLLRTHVNLVKKIQKFLPLSEIVLEINRFDFAKMENPNIKNWEYQKGRLSGFKDVRDAITQQQEHHCAFCNSEIEHIHHVVWKSKGGSDNLDNLIGLCKKHHDLVHKDEKWDEKCKVKKNGLLKKYYALSVINQTMPCIINRLCEILPLSVTVGYETKMTRERLDIEKDHYADAYCIAVSCLNVSKKPIIENKYDMKQYRRHDRQISHRMLDRTYKLDGKIVCKNRHKRIGQIIDSLEEFREKNPDCVDKLHVSIGRNVHKAMDRIQAGAVFVYDGKRYTCDGTSHSTYFLNKNIGKGFVRIDACKIIKQNTGLVFI